MTVPQIKPFVVTITIHIGVEIRFRRMFFKYSQEKQGVRLVYNGYWHSLIIHDPTLIAASGALFENLIHQILTVHSFCCKYANFVDIAH